MKHKEQMKALRYLSLLTQFGLSVAAPPLICVFAALWLQKKCGCGDWIIVCAIGVGLVSAGCTFWNFIKTYSKKEGGDSGDKNGPDRKAGDD